MLTSRLPGRVEPYKLAAHAEHLDGLVALADMSRLTEEAGAQQGDASVWLEFAIDAQGRRVIRGRLEAELQLPCRRCLEPMAQHVASDFQLGLVSSDDMAANLPATYEPVLVENEQLNLLGVIEDELILCLPQVVYHDESECPVSREQLSSGVETEVSEAPSGNPFEVLKHLKGNTDT